MGYRNLRECLRDLKATGRLIRIEEPIDPRLEAAEIQRRVFAAGGPAIFFANVKDCPFPMVSNLFGTMERVRYLFRDSLDLVERMIGLRADPPKCCETRGGTSTRPWRSASFGRGNSAAARCWPRKRRSSSFPSCSAGPTTAGLT